MLLFLQFISVGSKYHNLAVETTEMPYNLGFVPLWSHVMPPRDEILCGVPKGFQMCKEQCTLSVQSPNSSHSSVNPLECQPCMEFTLNPDLMMMAHLRGCSHQGWVSSLEWYQPCVGCRVTPDPVTTSWWLTWEDTHTNVGWVLLAGEVVVNWILIISWYNFNLNLNFIGRSS